MSHALSLCRLHQLQPSHSCSLPQPLRATAQHPQPLLLLVMLPLLACTRRSPIYQAPSELSALLCSQAKALQQGRPCINRVEQGHSCSSNRHSCSSGSSHHQLWLLLANQ